MVGPRALPVLIYALQVQLGDKATVQGGMEAFKRCQPELRSACLAAGARTAAFAAASDSSSEGYNDILEVCTNCCKFSEFDCVQLYTNPRTFAHELDRLRSGLADSSR